MTMIELAGAIIGGLLIGLALVALIYQDRVSSAMLQRMDRNSGRNGPNGDADAELARPTFDDYRLVLARAAVVMMAVALLLIGYLVFRLAGIASHAGLFTVILVLGTFLVIAIAGLTFLLVLPLLRGSLRAARVIAWLAAASLVSGIGIWMALPLLLPQIFLPPPELLLTEFRLNPAEATIQQTLCPFSSPPTGGWDRREATAVNQLVIKLNR